MHPFFERLKERKIVQWAVAYLAGAVALYSALDAFADPWGVGDVRLRIIQVVLFVGFVAALVVAWYHGERGEQRVTGIELLMLAALTGLCAIGIRLVTVGPSDARPLRIERPLRLHVNADLRGASHYALAEDGSALVYQGPSNDGGSQLWLRRLDELTATPISGTESSNADNGPDIAISPDGARVAYWEFGVRVSPIGGGAVTTLAEEPGLCCLGWDPASEWIYFTTRDGPVHRVRADGGGREAVTSLLPEDRAHRWPDALPDRQALLIERRTASGAIVSVYDRASGRIEDLFPGRHPRYSNGRIYFVDEGATSISSIGFDSRTGETVGEAAPVADGIGMAPGGVPFAVAKHADVIVYSPVRRWQPSWVNLDGSSRPIDPGWTFEFAPGAATWALSPATDKMAIEVGSAAESAVVIKELERGPSYPITASPGRERPIGWLNDDELLFLKDGNVFRQRADGIGEAELVVDHDVGFQFGEIGPSGEWLVLQSSGLDRREIWAMHLDRDEEPRMLIESPGFFLWKPTLSPDGRWLAYFSSQSGRNEVEVRSFPDVDRYRAVVSTGGGINPRWAPQGHVLYYFDQGRRLVSADLDLSGAPRVRERRPLHTVAPSFLVHQARTATRMTHDGRMVMIESIPELVVLVGSEPLSRQGQSRD